MANTYRGEIQDNKGNTVYPHTESEIVFCPDGDNVQEKLLKYENALGNVTGTTGSLEIGDANILATTEATKKLSENLDNLITPSDAKMEFGVVTTSGSPRTITLQGKYSEMEYFNISIFEGSLAFMPRDITFTAPNTVSFKLIGYLNSSTQNNTSAFQHGYMFAGK